MAQPARSSLTRPLLAKAQTTLIPSSPPPRPGALLRPPGLKLPPTTSTGLQLLPPSSFTLCGVDAPAGVSLPWSPGVPFWGLAFRAHSCVLDAVAMAVFTASGTRLVREDAGRPSFHQA